MYLRTINVLLRAVGLVLVVEVDHYRPTRLWVERSKTYDARCRRGA